MPGTDFDVNVHVKTDGKEKVDNLERQIEQLNGKTIKLKFDADGFGDISKNIETLNKTAIKSVQNTLRTKRTAETKATNEYLKENERQAGKLAQIQKKISQGFLEVDTSNIKKSLNKYSGIDSDRLKNAEASYKKLLSLGKELEAGIGIDGKRLSDNDILSKYNEYTDVFKKISNDVKILSNEFSSITKPFSSLDSIVASNKTLTWLKNNSAAAKDYGEELTNIAEAQRKATSADELKELNKRYRMVISEAAKNGAIGNSPFDEFKRAFMKIGQFSQIYGGIDKFVGSVSNAVTELKDMDDILTEISKVSEMSSSQLKQLGDDSFDYANKYGKTVTDYLEGVTEMNRSGYYGQQGIALANTSVLAQAAGDMSANVANAYLLATNAAYEYAGSAEKLNAVLDGQNMIKFVVMPCRKLMAS